MNIDVVKIELKKIRKISFETKEKKIYGIKDIKEIFLKEVSNSNVEEVGLICLDNDNKIINYSTVSIGFVNRVYLSISQIFKIALLSNSSKIIIAHNHPSGILEVTEPDLVLTKKILEISKILDIILIDSVIVNNKGELISIRKEMEKLNE